MNKMLYFQECFKAVFLSVLFLLDHNNLSTFCRELVEEADASAAYIYFKLTKHKQYW